ncbi:hypothetical protein G3M48_006522 [Beauveria asiatica]|uniref:Uncharacterized protein n=1 Tax=Beauveria asiatica TaxID=1069075 RepID=A0AAW0RP38_9HYPO
MKRLLAKYPDGLRDYMGGLEPTLARLPDTPPATPSRAQQPTQDANQGDNTGINTPQRTPLSTYNHSDEYAIWYGPELTAEVKSLKALLADDHPNRTSIIQAASDLFRCDDAWHSVSGAVGGGAVWPEWRKKGKQCIRGA